MDRSVWFLTPRERGNSSSSIDRRHGGTEAWTSDNLVIPLIHGRDYFARLRQVLEQTNAGDRVFFTDWRGDPDERLDGPGSEVVDLLVAVARRGVEVKGLVWRSHPDATRFSEEENRTLAKDVNEAGGNVLLDERVRRAGSHHQKLVVVLHPNEPDNDVAFVGGIDLCHGRNDDERHHGDPQAIEIDKRYGPTPAWHDMQVELQGATVGDIAETFVERWNDPTPLHRAFVGRGHAHTDAGAKNVEPISGVPHAERSVGTHAVQVLRTYPFKRPRYPFAPSGERSVARAYMKAFRRARRLIYIEDQYLWSADIAKQLGRPLPGTRTFMWSSWFRGSPTRTGVCPGRRTGSDSCIALRRAREAGGDRIAVYDLETGPMAGVRPRQDLHHRRRAG